VLINYFPQFCETFEVFVPYNYFYCLNSLANASDRRVRADNGSVSWIMG